MTDEQFKWPRRGFNAQERCFVIGQALGKKFEWARDPYQSLVEGERLLGSFILPPFQRPSVWTLEQKVSWIESALDGLPLPPYVVNRDLDDDYRYDRWLLDGQQRITAFLEFVNDGFPVRGWRFNEVDPSERNWFLSRPFACLETNLRDPEMMRQIYDRLAYGGTPHTSEDGSQ